MGMRRCQCGVAGFDQKRARTEAAMTHLYFHCATPEGLLLDCRGIAVDDLAEAHDCAAGIIRACIGKPGPEDWRAWSVSVSDDAGEELMVVPFAAVLGRPH
jgi:hypothetical protein